MSQRFTHTVLTGPKHILDGGQYPTITIEAFKLESARDMLNKLADRAESYGQTITWREESFEQSFEKTRWDGKRVKMTVRYVSIYVQGAAPKIGDHQFAAMLERSKGGVLVKALPGVEIGDYGQKWDGYCDHCGTKRDRVHGYVIENAGVRNIVGRSCVRDYLGMDVPDRLLNVLNQVTSLGEQFEEDGWEMPRNGWARDITEVMAAARCAVGMLGYAKSAERERSTAARVIALFGSSYDDREKEVKALRAEFNERADHYYEEGRKVVEWAQAIEGSSDYLNNLKVVVTGGYVTKDKLGIAVSAVVAYDNAMAKAARDAEGPAKPSTGHYGEVKKRVEDNVTVERIFAQNNQWGSVKRFFFRVKTGEILIWTTSFETELLINGRPVNSGDAIRLAFTPTRHSEYNGEKQTYVNRCKVV